VDCGVDQVGGAHTNTNTMTGVVVSELSGIDRATWLPFSAYLMPACRMETQRRHAHGLALAQTLPDTPLPRPCCMSFNKISCTPWPPANVAQTVDALVDLLLCLCCAAQAHEEVASLRIRMRSQEVRRHTHVLTQTCWVPQA
jgi:hypothetical protein